MIFDFVGFSYLLMLGSKMKFLGLEKCLESLVEVLRFVVTEYRAIGSHKDMIRDQNRRFWKPNQIQNMKVGNFRPLGNSVLLKNPAWVHS